VLLSSLSTKPVGDVVAALRDHDRAMLLDLFTRMRSGRGFLNDLRPRPTPPVGGQLTLWIATRTDGRRPLRTAR
jgi:hypothetical protein